MCELINYVFIVVIMLLTYIILRQQYGIKDLREIHSKDSVLLEKAYFDPLTALPNEQNIQIILKEQISRCERHDKSFFVALIKVYDNSDEVFKESAIRIFDSVRSEDIVGRISKNIFIVVFNEYLETSHTDIIVKRIEHAFDKRFTLKTQENKSFKVSINVQIKTFPEKSTVQELMNYVVKA